MTSRSNVNYCAFTTKILKQTKVFFSCVIKSHNINVFIAQLYIRVINFSFIYNAGFQMYIKERSFESNLIHDNIGENIDSRICFRYNFSISIVKNLTVLRDEQCRLSICIERQNGLITVAIFSVHFNNKLIHHVDECRINGRIIKGFRVPAANVHFSFARRVSVVAAIGKRYSHFCSFYN